MNNNKLPIFETFTNTRKRFSEPFVSISISKTFSLSAGFIKIANKQLNNYENVILLFSPSKKIVGFKFVEDYKEIGAIKMTIQKKLSNFRISCPIFFSFYSLDVSTLTGRYPVNLEKIPTHGEVWTINLNEKDMV